jgi:CRP/FNR family transcriptional regulator
MENKFPIPFCARRKNSVFCSPQNPLHSLGDNISKKYLSFAKNEFIYHAGETAKGIFCIYSGTIKIVKQINFNQEITIHKATDGEIIGFNFINTKHISQT